MENREWSLKRIGAPRSWGSCQNATHFPEFNSRFTTNLSDKVSLMKWALRSNEMKLFNLRLGKRVGRDPNELNRTDDLNFDWSKVMHRFFQPPLFWRHSARWGNRSFPIGKSGQAGKSRFHFFDSLLACFGKEEENPLIPNLFPFSLSLHSILSWLSFSVSVLRFPNYCFISQQQQQHIHFKTRSDLKGIANNNSHSLFSAATSNQPHSLYLFFKTFINQTHSLQTQDTFQVQVRGRRFLSPLPLPSPSLLPCDEARLWAVSFALPSTMDSTQSRFRRWFSDNQSFIIFSTSTNRSSKSSLLLVFQARLFPISTCNFNLFSILLSHWSPRLVQVQSRDPHLHWNSFKWWCGKTRHHRHCNSVFNSQQR